MPTGVYERTSEMNEAKCGPHHTPAQIAADNARRIPHTTPAQIAADKAMRGVPNPHTSPAQIAADNAQIGVPHSPERIVAIKKGQEDAGTHNRQRGGHDIVDHHMIYDHSDLSKNIMPMTRSIHGKLHALFRKYEIEIPHINIGRRKARDQKAY